MENTTPLYNTYGDLYDAPQIVYSIDGNSEEIKEISPDTRIDSLEIPLWQDDTRKRELTLLISML